MTANTLLSIGMITEEALVVLENQLTFTKHVNRQYDSAFGNQGRQIGDTLSVRVPPRYTARTTAPFTAQGSVESTVPITLDKQYGVDMSFTSKELTLDINSFSEQFLKPAVAAVSNKIDYDGMQLYKDVYQLVGTPGTTPSTMENYLNAGVKLDNSAAPNDDMRFAVVNPAAQAKIVYGNQALFNPNSDISKQYREGTMGRAAGFGWSMDQNVGVQTIGTYAANVAGGAVTVNGAVSSGSSIVLAGWASGDILNEGDVVTFGSGTTGVYSVNPQNRQSTGQLQQFVVTSTATASGGGAMTITVSPALVFSGNFQNVYSATSTLATSTVLNVYGASATSTPQNLVFHRDAFTFATADLIMPNSGVKAYKASSKKLGMSIRIVEFFDGINDRNNYRLDLLGGWATLRPELACRVAG